MKCPKCDKPTDLNVVNNKDDEIEVEIICPDGHVYFTYIKAEDLCEALQSPSKSFQRRSEENGTIQK